ncbi:MAG: methyl-accepting chemotaxis protein [Oscillospiraceae bacterium]|nr:methyl-accepting chemotaxis protein [Oscillospiraceae bacterium]
MKNLKVRVKILLGFGVAIAMLVIIVAVVFVSNAQTSANLANVKFDTDLQTITKTFTLHYLEASIDLEAAHIVKSGEAYERVVRDIDVVYADLEEMLRYIGNDLSKSDYVSKIKAIETIFLDWKKSIAAVQESNQALRQSVAASDEQQEALRLKADATYRNQQEIWERETQEDTTSEDKLRRVGRLDETVVFIRDIDMLIRTGESMTRAYDISRSEEFFIEMDRVIALLQENGDVARNQGTQDTAYATVDALNGYRAAFYAFDSTNKQNKAAIAEAQRLGNIAYDAANEFLSDLADSVYDAVDTTISYNSLSLIIAIVVALIAIAVAVLIALYISGQISNPLIMMSRALEQLGTTGNLNFPPKVMQSAQECSLWQDEIGRCARAFGGTIQHIGNVAKELDTMANGDLNVAIEQLSEEDVLGRSVNHMANNLNRIFGEINSSTAQVFSGSKQIADGAQALAHGSIQQAASVETLLTSITEISRMTKDNEDTATETLTDVQQAGTLMGVCIEQMRQMTAAMKSIDEKSRNITNTTKVIDDIAFQTNILALNAAVEAARAGQHGKGFAVVAEEVRNLASKSADAAKKTAALIESSSQSVYEGNQIVEKVNASLLSVAEIAQKNARQTEKIQSVSTQQSTVMDQVNTSINRVTQVIQQNSATAEQNAAMSEEMNGQTAMLEDLVSQFKLKDDGTQLSSGSRGTVKQIAMPSKTPQTDGGDFGKY